METRPNGNPAKWKPDQKEKTVMARIFIYDEREFPDPGPNLSVEEVKAHLADFYGEIATATVKETKRGEDTLYEFQRRVGTKGSGEWIAGRVDSG
jgi:PRTRC genetic system protein C